MNRVIIPSSKEIIYSEIVSNKIIKKKVLQVERRLNRKENKKKIVIIEMRKETSLIIVVIIWFTVISEVMGITQNCQYSADLNSSAHSLQLSSLQPGQCPTNSHCQSNNFCICDHGYFANCQTPGQYLTSQSKSFTINESMSYFIIQPSIGEFVSFQFFLCNEQNSDSKGQFVNLWADDGTLETPTENNAMGNDKEVKMAQGCIALVTSFFTFGKQQNGEPQKLIFGIRLKQPGTAKIQLSMQQLQLFGIDIIFRIILILVCAIALLSLGAAIYCIYKCRTRGRIGDLNEERNDISFFDEYMPVKRVNLQELKEEICSVCLAEYKEGEEIRHTVCTHYFHKACLDEWCVTNLSCPICRTSFQKANLIHQQYIVDSRQQTQSTSNQPEELQNHIINDSVSLRQPIV